MVALGVRASRYLGSAAPAPRAQWTIVGQDGGQSVDLGRRSLFLFSDTLLAVSAEGRGGDGTDGSADAGWRVLANSAATGEGADLRSALRTCRYFCDDDGLVRELLPATAGEQAARLRFWPQHGVAQDGGVHLYYLGIEATGDGSAWAFRSTGVGLAHLDLDTGVAARVHGADGDWRLWPPLGDDFHFGVAVVARGDDVLVFGSVRRGLDLHGILARVPAERITDPRAYRWLGRSGRRWVVDRELAGSLGPCAGDYSVSFNAHLGGYLMTYVDGFDKRLLLRVAERLEGPWSAPLAVGRLPHHETSELLYCGFEHPRFAREGGRRVVVSYSQPHFSANTLMEVRLS